MADALIMLEHGHGRQRADSLYQGFAAARYHHINKGVQAAEQGHGLAVGHGHELGRILGEACLFEGGSD